jgi:inhibitor of cysteine peptidase
VTRVVQQEIRKKTKAYGVIAILSALMLVALIFAFGSAPMPTPGSPGTGTPTSSSPTTLSNVSPMKTFTSYEELKNFLAANSKGGYFGGGPLDAEFFGSPSIMLGPTATPIPAPAAEYGMNVGVTSSYSTTNIQVAGVDEADTVKTDGRYIYTVSTNNYGATPNFVCIVKADPQDPRVVAKISLDNNTYPAGMFLSQDGNRLVIVASQYEVYPPIVANSATPMIYPYRSDVNTFINVYDVSDKGYPVLARNFTISGSYFDSRMIGSYVYAVVSQPAYLLTNGSVTLPQVYQDTKAAEIVPQSIYYADTVDNYFTFTTFIGLNIVDNAQEPTNMTVMMGGTSAMYVSLNNIYVTYSRWSQQGQYTSIYRIHVAGNNLTFEAEGDVTGYVLNQYSMDEYNGYFRLATTVQNETWQNKIFVLDMNLTTVGELGLENLAAHERIYSARFMGDKCYVVTFEQKDPFFVVDMSNPASPKVAGTLQIPGYSSYLHPYDENHIIGLGMESNTVKLSLFDVTNVNQPTEIAKYIVAGDWTYSQALQDPKAFLFDEQKELLVIPVSITQYGVVSPGAVTPSPIGTPIVQGSSWQGAYVFKLTLTDGFQLRGGITHMENGTVSPNYGINYDLTVNRALYIDNTLYTVSNSKVKLNSLTDLAQIAEVKLG